MNRTFWATLALLGSLVTAQAATLLPNGKQQFFNANGAPLAGGSVYFYTPGTTTFKNTWQDSAQTILNTNPVLLDISGSAIVYGSGCYREIVQDSSGNTIWDQPTCDTSSTSLIWAGHSSGTANNQTLTASNFTAVDGQSVYFIAGQTNTGALTLTINGGAALNVLKDTPSGSFSLSGGEVFLGNLVQVTYDATRGAFHLANNPVIGSNPQSTLTATGTTDLGTAASRFINITGSGTITSFGSSASPSFPLYTLTFSGGQILTASGNLILPGGANITTNAGDYALAAYQGSGNWQVLAYYRANGAGIVPLPITQFLSSCPYTVLTSGGNNPTRLEVEMVGGGGGGGGNGNDGGTGGTTSFNGVTAVGGGPGIHSTNNFGVDGGIGGTGGAGASDIRLAGQTGNGSGANEGATGVGASGVVSGNGGRAASSFSWGGAWSPSNNSARQAGGYGGGGAGYASGVTSPGSSSGGGGGEYVRMTINPFGTSSIACALGAGGTAGTSGGIGGIGAIVVRSFWN